MEESNEKHIMRATDDDLRISSTPNGSYVTERGETTKGMFFSCDDLAIKGADRLGN